MEKINHCQQCTEKKMHKEVIGTRFIVVSESAAENIFQKYFLTLLNLSSIKYKVSTINHISIFHLNNFEPYKYPSRFLKKLKRLIVKANAKAIFEI